MLTHKTYLVNSDTHMTRGFVRGTKASDERGLSEASPEFLNSPRSDE